MSAKQPTIRANLLEMAMKTNNQRMLLLKKTKTPMNAPYALFVPSSQFLAAFREVGFGRLMRHRYSGMLTPKTSDALNPLTACCTRGSQHP